ncbi:NlpC/P60 family protein [Spirillospora sp. NPDC049652]
MTAASGPAPGAGEFRAEPAPSIGRQNIHQFPAKDDLNGRAGKSLNSGTVKFGQYRRGRGVPVVCQDDGEVAHGSVIWDYTADRTWVPDHDVRTGSDGFAPGVPRCGSSRRPGSRTLTASADLAGRSGKGLSSPTRRVYKKGTPVTLTCQAYGDFAAAVPSGGGSRPAPAAGAPPVGPSTGNLNAGPSGEGSYIWDRTRERLWVADAHLRPGAGGFLKSLPRCDDDPPTDGGAAKGGGKRTSDCFSPTAVHGRDEGPGGVNDGTAAHRRARIVAAARSMTGHGYSYAWGGGGKGGPSCGIASPSPGGHVDYRRYGFDCSGLSSYAVWKALGVDPGADTRHQYRSPHGRKVSWAHRLPGDLLFWGRGTANSTYHVAVYAGGGRIIEAAPPRGATSIHVKRAYGSRHWMPSLIRFAY